MGEGVRMKANLVRTVKLGRRTHYVYSCIDCGNEYIRAVYGKHINPYCADCNRKYLRERQKKQLELKQQAHDKKVRAEVIEEYLKLIKQYEDTTGSIDVYKCENIAEQLKEQNNE